MKDLIEMWQTPAVGLLAGIDPFNVAGSCAKQLKGLIDTVYTEPPTKAQYDAHVAKHGPWMRILIADSDYCRGGWFIARLNWFDYGHREQAEASTPGTTWAIGGGDCIGYQWSDERGLPVEAPGVPNDGP